MAPLRVAQDEAHGAAIASAKMCERVWTLPERHLYSRDNFKINRAAAVQPEARQGEEFWDRLPFF